MGSSVTTLAASAAVIVLSPNGTAPVSYTSTTVLVTDVTPFNFTVTYVDSATNEILLVATYPEDGTSNFGRTTQAQLNFTTPGIKLVQSIYRDSSPDPVPSEIVPLAVESTTSLALTGPTSSSIGTQDASVATLVALYNGTQYPLSNQTITFTFRGDNPDVVLQGRTDAQGQVTVQHAFSTTGCKTVVASFAGSPNLVYLASTSAPLLVQVAPQPMSSTPTATATAPPTITPTATMVPPTTTPAPTCAPCVCPSPAPLLPTSLLPPTSSPPPTITKPALKVSAFPKAAEFPDCGKNQTFTASFTVPTVTGSIAFDFLTSFKPSRHLGDVPLSGGSATLTTNLFPIFALGDHTIRITYTGDAPVDNKVAEAPYAVSAICI